MAVLEYQSVFYGRLQGNSMPTWPSDVAVSQLVPLYCWYSAVELLVLHCSDRVGRSPKPLSVWVHQFDATPVGMSVSCSAPGSKGPVSDANRGTMVATMTGLTGGARLILAVTTPHTLYRFALLSPTKKRGAALSAADLAGATLM